MNNGRPWAAMLLVTGISALQGWSTPTMEHRLGEVAENAFRKAETLDQRAVAGRDGWLFPVGEMRYLSRGVFWGNRAREVSRARNPEYADPLPAILAYHKALAARGITLILLPVPPKASIYPEKLNDDLPAARCDPVAPAFYSRLEEAGVQVIDPGETLAALARKEGVQAYCRTDSHWSPAACERAAALAAARIKDMPWYRELPKQTYARRATELHFTGDLNPEGAGNKESLPFVQVGMEADGQIHAIPGDDASPVILMGDSHTLVFNDGELLANRGGLADHLAAQLGMPLDLSFRSRAGGATQVRVDLLRRQMTARRNGEDYLEGKNVVIWCFAAREFTEATGGWREVPVDRQP